MDLTVGRNRRAELRRVQRQGAGLVPPVSEGLGRAVLKPELFLKGGVPANPFGRSPGNVSAPL